MGFDLINEKGDRFEFCYSDWGFYLRLAVKFGWQPAGTEAPTGKFGWQPAGTEAWPGTYETSDGQRVSSVDAEALASALQRAMDDPEWVESSREIARARAGAVRIAGSDYEVRATVRGDVMPFLRDMIAFFCKGRFRIW
jgi:hypothetical protein